MEVGSRLPRLQGALVVLTLLAAVVGTVFCVLSPPRPASAASDPPTRLPLGVRVAVQGGDPLSAYRVADRLTAEGATLERVTPGAASETAADARIVYYERRQQPAAERVRQLLGGGTLQRSEVFEPIVDVTIVLGKDQAHA